MIPIMRLLNDDKGDYIWKKKNQVSPHTKSDLKSRLETIEKEERNLRQLELEGASQEYIQHKQENIGVHFKAIWNMLTAVASITGVPLDTSNKPEVVIPTHKQSEDEALTPQPHRLGAQPQLPVRIGSPRVPCACTRWPSASP